MGASKFNWEIAARVCELVRKGLTIHKVEELLGLSKGLILTWTKSHPPFLWDLNEAKVFADDYIQKSLFGRATGYTVPTERIFLTKGGKVIRVKTLKHYPPDVTAQIFWLKNRRPNEWRESLTYSQQGAKDRTISNKYIKKSFQQFCIDAGYPPPYAKQVEMKEFVLDNEKPEARLLLGSRGYGKTDYALILGVAYKLYLDSFRKKPRWTCLLVTKSDQRNAAILNEIAKAAEANGVLFEKDSASAIRVAGLDGKDHSVSAVTIGTSSLRGRHPKKILIEDIVTEEDAHSKAHRRRVERVYNELFKLCSDLSIIGQPVHKHDLYEMLRPKLKKMEVPYGSIPELDADLEAQRLAGVSEESIQASYFLKVVGEGDSPFENIRYIDKMPAGETVAFIDPSHEGGDHTALTVMQAHFEGLAVQGHVWKRAWNHCLDKMVEKMLELNVQRICFETNALGDQPVIMLRDALDGVGVVGKKSTGPKHAAIVAAGAYANLIHLSKESDAEYIRQVVQYEYGAEPDDGPDSLARGMEWIGLIRGRTP